MRDPLPDHRWAKLETLFFLASELPPSSRVPFVDSECGNDPELRQEVLSLLDYGDLEPPDLFSALEADAASVIQDEPVAGRMLGPYRIERELGRGGMAVVYLGVRADGDFRKRVAIKLIKRGMDTAAVIERLRRERRILASLDHPYIAHLLDGGSTPQGLPYLAMEYVEGLPIDRYSEQHGLSIERRCELIAKVCEAVSYAHRKLVVHRDLKPGNILISGDGIPKLLDFGLAKILDPEIDGGVTVNQAHARPMTPDYASPEQVRGLEPTTATDVYSLGVVLYELLAGMRPYRLQSAAYDQWVRAVCHGDAPRPSLANRVHRRRLEGDLDNIVMKAMHKDAERRYASPDDLAADLRRHLDSRPVLARQDSFGYRAGKFIRRRRLPLLAAAAVAASLVMGIVASVTQAREADRARHIAEVRETEADRDRHIAESEHRAADRERDAAITERQRAEERLAEIVGLSDRSLSDVYGQLERLSGAAPARREMIGTTLESLERLSKEAGANPRLQAALAKAYFALGDLQADPNGDSVGALKSYMAGSELIADTTGQRSPDPDRLLLWLNLQAKIAEMLGRRNQVQKSKVLLRHALQVIAGMPQALFDSKDMARARAALYLWLARGSGPDFVRAREYALEYVNRIDALVRRYPGDADLQYDLSIGQVLTGWVASSLDDPDTAARYYEQAIDVREQLVREHPADRVYRSALMLSYEHYAGLQGRPTEANLGNPDLARVYYKKAQPFEEAAAADPNDPAAAAKYALFLFKSADLEIPAGAPAERLTESLATLRRAISILEPLAEARTYYAPDLADIYRSLGQRLEATGDDDAALSAYRRSLAIVPGVLAARPDHRDALRVRFECELGVIRILARQGKRTEAVDGTTRLILAINQAPVGEEGRAFRDFYLARAYLTLAKTYRAFDDPARAHEAALEAVRRAFPLATGRRWDPNGRLVEEAQVLAAACAAQAPP